MELTPENSANLYGFPDPDIQVPEPEKRLEDPQHYNQVWIDGEWCQL